MKNKVKEQKLEDELFEITYKILDVVETAGNCHIAYADPYLADIDICSLSDKQMVQVFKSLDNIFHTDFSSHVEFWKSQSLILLAMQIKIQKEDDRLD